VVDRIGAVGTGSVGPFKSDAPLKPIIIQKIEEVDATAAAPPPVPPVAAPATSPAATAPAVPSPPPQ